MGFSGKDAGGDSNNGRYLMSTLHQSTFEFLKPDDNQLTLIADLRAHFADFAQYLDEVLPEGPDKTYLLRHLRECSYWANVTILRTADGTPRS